MLVVGLEIGFGTVNIFELLVSPFTVTEMYCEKAKDANRKGVVGHLAPYLGIAPKENVRVARSVHGVFYVNRPGPLSGSEVHSVNGNLLQGIILCRIENPQL